MGIACKFSAVNIRLYLAEEEQDLERDMLPLILSEYSCPINSDVENFLKKQAVDFTLKDQSVTYLVFSNKNAELLGYFTLTVKPITINASEFSNHMKRKLERVGEYDKVRQTYNMAAYLIAQLGKNYSRGANEFMTGKELLDLAIEQVKELQYQAGGTVVFLESEDREKLKKFYQEENGFREFGAREIMSRKHEPHRLVQMLKVI